MKETVVHFPERDTLDMRQIEHEASIWLIRMDGDTPLNEEERTTLREWLTRSPVHKKELSEQAAFWGNLNLLTELSVPLGDESSQERVVDFGFLARPAFIATFALILFFITASVFVARPTPALKSNGYYATAIGQRDSITLADGSIVALNTNTQIEVSFSQESRGISLLQGEAHFQVAEDASKPFRVYTDDGVFEAVGTAFSVRLRDGAADLVVTDGVVAVASPLALASKGNLSEDGRLPSLASVSAGQATAVVRTNALNAANSVAIANIRAVDERDIARTLSWRKGYLTFSGESLAEAIVEINRYTTFTIEIDDPTLKTLRIGGRVPLGDSERIVSALEVNFGLTVTRIGAERILLTASH